MLALLSREHLISTLGVKEHVADKIAFLGGRREFTSLDEFQPVLGDDMKHVIDRIQSVRQENHSALCQQLKL